MRTGTNHSTGRGGGTDGGFTLVELLIVIVILGILATVTVFAVRGVTDSGEESAEATDLRAIQQATEAYTAENGTNPTEQELVDGGFMNDLSLLHDVAVDGAGVMTITNVRTGVVADSVGPPAAPGSGGGPVGLGGWSGTPTTVGSFDAVTHGSGSNTFLLLGGPDAQAVWNAQIDGGNVIAPFLDRTYVVVPFASIPDQSALDDLVAAADGRFVDWEFSRGDEPGGWTCPTGPLGFETCADIAMIDAGYGYLTSPFFDAGGYLGGLVFTSP